MHAHEQRPPRGGLRHGDRLTVGSVVMTVLMPQPGYPTTEHTTQAPETLPPFYVASSTGSQADSVAEAEPKDGAPSKRSGH